MPRFKLSPTNQEIAERQGRLTEEDLYLLRAFATYKPIDIISLSFMETFRHPPTPTQLRRNNIAATADFCGNDLQPSGFKNNIRVLAFMQFRKEYKKYCEDLPIRQAGWRQEKYQEMFDIAMKRHAAKPGSPADILSIMKHSVQDASGAFGPAAHLYNIDNRTVNINRNMSDKELDDRIGRLLEPFKVKLPTMAPAENQGQNCDSETAESVP